MNARPARLVAAAVELYRTLRLYHCRPDSQDRSATWEIECHREDDARAFEAWLAKVRSTPTPFDPQSRYEQFAALLGPPTDETLGRLLKLVPRLRETAIRARVFHQLLSDDRASKTLDHSREIWSTLLRHHWLHDATVQPALRDRTSLSQGRLWFASESPHARTEFQLRIQLAELDESILDTLHDSVSQEAFDDAPALAPRCDEPTAKALPWIEPTRIDELLQFANEAMKQKQRRLVLYLIECNGNAALKDVQLALEWACGIPGKKAFERCQSEANKKLKRKRFRIIRHDNRVRLEAYESPTKRRSD